MSQRKPSVRSEAERNALVEQYQWLPRWFLKRFRWKDGFSDDELQECFLVLMRAAELWEPDRGTFTTYAVMAMRGRACRIFSDSDGLLPLDPATLQVAGRPEEGDPGQLPPEVQQALDGLQERQRSVLWRNVCEDRPLHLIARDLGISRERARQIRNTALEHLRHLLRPA